MRTTITLDEALLKEAKARAAKRGTTLSAVVADALRMAFEHSRTAPTALPPLPVFHGDGLQPGVTLDDAGALWDQHDDESGYRDRS